MAVALFDTNILIDFLKGYKPAIEELEYSDDGVISSITWMELMAGARTRDDEEYLAELLGNFRVIHTDEHIMRLAASIRRGSIELGPKVALPDTIIMATGQLHSDVVITRNKKDFRLLRHLGEAPDSVRADKHRSSRLYQRDSAIPDPFIRADPREIAQADYWYNSYPKHHLNSLIECS